MRVVRGAPNDIVGLSLTEGGDTIIVGGSWQECSVVADCMTAPTPCDDCCGRESVAKSQQARYASAFEELCAGYQGGVCDYQIVETETACDADECTLVEL